MWFVYPQGLSYHSGDGEHSAEGSLRDAIGPLLTIVLLPPLPIAGQLILLNTRMGKPYVVSLSIQPPQMSAERQCAKAPSGSALTGHLAARSANTKRGCELVAGARERNQALTSAKGVNLR